MANGGRCQATTTAWSRWAVAVLCITCLDVYGTHITSRGAEPISLVWAYDPNGNTKSARSLTFSPDGKTLVAGCGAFIGLLQEPRPGQAIIWDVASAKQLRVLTGHEDGVSSVAFSGDGKLLATTGYRGEVHVWTVGTWQQVYTKNVVPSVPTSVQFTKDGRNVVVGLWQEVDSANDVMVWAIRTGDVRRLKGHAEPVVTVAISPDGLLAASAGMEGSVLVWDTTNWKRVAVLQGTGGWVRAMAFCHHNRGLLGACSGAGAITMTDTTLRLWKCGDWERFEDIAKVGGSVRSMDIHPNGSLVAIALESEEGELWDLEKRRRIAAIPGGAIVVRFDPRAQYLACTTGPGRIALWKVADIPK